MNPRLPPLMPRLASYLSLAAILLASGLAIADIAWWMAGRSAVPGVIAVALIMITALGWNATHQGGTE